MFVRAKKSGQYKYLQLVHNERVDGHIRPQGIATLGRLDRLQQSGQIDALVTSCARFAERTTVLEAHRRVMVRRPVNVHVPGVGRSHSPGGSGRG